jgi:uncharacterized protein YqeY
MTFYEQIQEDLKTAMKSGNEVARDTLRFLVADIKKDVVDAGADRENISDETVMKVLEKSVKSRKESIKVFEEQGRADLADPEKSQLEVIAKYLPQQLSDEELKTIVDKIKAENPTIQGPAIMGKIMPHVKGKADPDRIKALL